MKIKKVTENFIEFDNGSLLDSFHESDCCEDRYDYVEFSSIQGQGWEEKDFPEDLNLLVRKISNSEIFDEDLDRDLDGDVWRSFVKLLDVYGNEYVLNIYNSNNGYYSSNVSLVYTNQKGYKQFIKIQ